MTTPFIDVSQLRCHFKSGDDLLAAVDGVNLQIAAGEVLGLVGESGSGKSTLGRVIAGLQARSAGTLLVDGKEMPHQYSRRQFRAMSTKVQMVFQDSYASLNPRMTILASLQEPLWSLGVRGKQARDKAAYWLDRVGLPQSAGERYPHELSGGQRQRIGIARAFIAEPKLVICDEPVSALDVSVQAQIINLLQELQREHNTAMLFIAHDLAVVRFLASRTAVMYLGEIVEIGPTAAVFESPRHPYTVKLLAAHLDGNPRERVLRSLADVKAVANKAPLASDSGCRFAPRCQLATRACSDSPPWLQLSVVDTEAACHRLAYIDGGGSQAQP
ncbi:oligopeptide/dipeptide ABC transporter ATP-binding protein [Zhongshania aliphaticivorans]|uniref:oligopeptide/dipeptide ABC transporter ATP-binding protein n=1 Tax=Zhongshania aliphaticivorans TaxID=1470434 RepID=UPI0012E497A6|nr:oligopeptide/dipeptide ABC transporter ATP-binding protein [Zhongshania aliphaticivorans]CAA0107943.1 Oligopeptide transport ATP-binding protein OppF [Zhongshania aliphaticivorans]